MRPSDRTLVMHEMEDRLANMVMGAELLREHDIARLLEAALEILRDRKGVAK